MSEDSVDYETASEPAEQLDLGDLDSPSPSPPPPSRTAYVPPHRRNAERKHLPSTDENGPRQSDRVPYQPRRRLSESELPKPSATYLGIADQSSDTLSMPPLIVVLVFNTTLVQRCPGNADERKDPLTRPYLSTFLSYLFHTPKDSSTQPLFRPRRPFQTVIYTGMRVHNILAVLKALELAPPQRKLGFREPYSVDPEQGDIFSLILSREDMKLGDAYFENVDTVKDLRLVWERLGVEEEDGAKRTVLISSQAVDAVSFFFLRMYDRSSVSMLGARLTFRARRQMAQPDSQLFIPAFLPTDSLDNDTALLSTIAKLEGLAQQTNIPSFIRNDGLSTIALAPPSKAQRRPSTPDSDSTSKRGVDLRLGGEPAGC